jgi:acylphosphatase
LAGQKRKALRVTVQGRVQGVGYREFVRRAAGRLNVTGWVRNRPDSGVEAQICGGPPEIQTLLREMKTGPRWADVTTLSVVDDGEAEVPDAFRILPTREPV